MPPLSRTVAIYSVPRFIRNSGSAPLDEAIHHLLAPGLVEIHGELVAVDLRDAAIAEFLVKHAHAHGETCALHCARRHQRTVDGDRLPRPWAGGRASRRPVT